MGAARADAPTLLVDITCAGALAREFNSAESAEVRHQQLHLQTVDGF